MKFEFYPMKLNACSCLLAEYIIIIEKLTDSSLKCVPFSIGKEVRKLCTTE
jgi:hypothetical protein